MKRLSLLSLVIVVASLTGSPALATSIEVADSTATYVIDPVHSEMSFRIRHLMGRVFGFFTEWEGTVSFDPADLSSIEVDVTVQTASINTLNEQRNDHLRTPDFFAVEDFPTMTFVSTHAVQHGNAIEVHGELTIRGTTKPVVLMGRFQGEGPDPWGGERVGFTASTVIDRQDFGVSFNQFLEGASVIGDEVEISIAIEAVKA